MITSITKIFNKVFLATVLVAGIIAIYSPSFMIGAQAQQEPIAEVEKLKCNNDNFNIDVTNPQALSEVENKIQSLLAQENAGYNTENHSMGEDIVLVCTNTNNAEGLLPVS
jgi:hypothetical protein